MGWRFIDFVSTSKAFLNPIAGHIGIWGDVLIYTGSIALVWGLLYFLYKRKIFLKV
jgi:hypothetical protein